MSGGRPPTGKAERVIDLYDKGWPHSCIAAKLMVTEPYIYQTLKYRPKHDDFSVVYPEMEALMIEGKYDQFIHAELGVPPKIIREYRVALIRQYYPRNDELFELLIEFVDSKVLYTAIEDDTLLDAFTQVALKQKMFKGHYPVVSNLVPNVLGENDDA